MRLTSQKRLLRSRDMFVGSTFQFGCLPSKPCFLPLKYTREFMLYCRQNKRLVWRFRCQWIKFQFCNSAPSWTCMQTALFVFFLKLLRPKNAFILQYVFWFKTGHRKKKKKHPRRPRVSLSDREKRRQEHRPKSPWVLTLTTPFAKLKRMLAPDQAQKKLFIVVPDGRTAYVELFSCARTRRLLSRPTCPVCSPKLCVQGKLSYLLP